MEVISTIYAAGSSRNSHIRLNKHLDTIAKYLNTSSYRNYFTPSDLSKIIYGISNTVTPISSNYPSSFRRVIVLLTQKLSQINSTQQPFTMIDATMAMYGFKTLNSACPEVRQLLRQVTMKIESCQETLDARAVGGILYGCKNMNSDYAEVRQLLYVIVPKIKSCNESLSGQTIGNCLFGLQSMLYDCNEVQQLLNVLSSKIKSSPHQLKALEVSNALYGLHAMKSDNNEVRDIVKSISMKIESCAESFTARQVANSLYGIHSLSSQHMEVQKLLQTLTPKIVCCIEPLNFQALGNSLYGLHQKKSIPKDLIRYMEKSMNYSLNQIQSSTYTPVAADALCLYQSLLFTCTLNNCSNSATSDNNYDTTINESIVNHLSEEGRHVVTALKEALFQYLQGEDMKKHVESCHVSKTKEAFLNQLETLFMRRYHDQSIVTNSTTVIMNMTATTPPPTSEKVLIMTRKVLLHGFYCDFLMCWKGAVIDFELSESTHRYHAKKIFHQLRDAYLKTVHNVTVIRRRQSMN